VVREGGFEFLGPTVSEGDMQHLREAAKVKNTAGKFKINGQQVQMHAFYNALQANGGAVQAVRPAIRLMAVAIKLSNICLLSKAASQKTTLLVQTFDRQSQSDPLHKVAQILGIRTVGTWRYRMRQLWKQQLTPFMLPGDHRPASCSAAPCCFALSRVSMAACVSHSDGHLLPCVTESLCVHAAEAILEAVDPSTGPGANADDPGTLTGCCSV
jgi:hypothetical protein